MTRSILLPVLSLTFAALLTAAPANPGRGKQLFSSLRCASCHSAGGAGAKTAPALGGAAFTPNTMAGAMWSHSAKMWDAMTKAGIARPKISPEQAADLQAFLSGGKTADAPGSAAAGRKVYEAKFCASCHDDSIMGAPSLLPLAGKTTSFTMISALSEHGAGMLSRMVSKNTAWQTLSPAEMGNLIAYLNTKKK